MYVIYHDQCFDGFTAAWVAKCAHSDAVLLPANHGQPIPDTPLGSRVYMIDISFPRALMVAYGHGRHLRTLDHHKTAEAALVGFPDCVFDMNRSGAMLAWNEFHPDSQDGEAPWLVQYTQDSDLWRFALPQSREIGAFIESYPRTLEAYDALDAMLEGGLAQCAEVGSALLRMKDQKISEISQYSFTAMIGGYTVPVVNTSCFFSEVANRLCVLYPDKPFAAYYFRRNDGVTQFGLRSDNGFDVSEVAKLYGGGGHKAASGFQLETDAEVYRLFEDSTI
jgi:oligoribonuclease NrnB/cAMP/cGMP phosphodiesterase (DHH superfamily)